MREKRIALSIKTSYPQWYDFLCLFCNTSIGFLRFLAIFSSRFCFGPTLFHFFFHFVNEIFFPYFKEHLRIRIELLAIFFVIPICLRKYLQYRLCLYTITSYTITLIQPRCWVTCILCTCGSASHLSYISFKMAGLLSGVKRPASSCCFEDHA